MLYADNQPAGKPSLKSTYLLNTFAGLSTDDGHDSIKIKFSPNI